MKNAFLLKKLYCQKAAQKFTMALQTSQRFDFSNLDDKEQIPLRYETVYVVFWQGFMTTALIISSSLSIS
jgi:hypothetical protein